MSNNFQFVNWADGMKISANHFKEMENVLMSNIEIHNRSHTYYFSHGALKPLDSYNESIKYRIKQSGGEHVTIDLDHCFGITPGGLTLIIDRELGKALYQNQKVNINSIKNDESYYLVLRVKSNNRVPHGEIAENESPIRHQYSYYDCDFSLITDDELNTTSDYFNLLILGKLQYKNETFTTDKDYIIPAASLQSLESLRDFYNDTLEFFGQMDGYCINIFKKCNERSSSLSNNVKELVTRLLNYMGNLNFELNNILFEQSPVYLVKCYANLTAELRLYFKLIEDGDKEELLKYFEEWTQISPGEFQDSIKGVLSLSYRHLNISESLNNISIFKNKTLQIFKELNNLDFIGKRKQDLGIVYEKKKPKPGIFNPIKR